MAFLLQKGVRILSRWAENKLNGTAVGRGQRLQTLYVEVSLNFDCAQYDNTQH